MPEVACHLVDGLILTIARETGRLFDVRNKKTYNLKGEVLESLEKLAAGNYSGPALKIPWLGETVATVGPLQADPVIVDSLAELDQTYMCSYFDGLPDRARQAYDAVLTAHAHRKRFWESVGQCPALPETVLRRALLLGEDPLDVVCVGDDDFLSVALAALGHHVTVFEIDELVVGILGKVAATAGLEIETFEVNLRTPLEERFVGRFDVFVTDPMSNRDCFELFLSRGFSMLRPGGKGFTAVHPAACRLFREIADERKFAIANWHRRHNRYYGPDMLLHEYESDWVEVHKTDATDPQPDASSYSLGMDLYTEMFQRRPMLGITTIEDIEDVRFAMPFYLEPLLDTAVENVELRVRTKSTQLGLDATSIYLSVARGHIVLHVDRKKRRILLETVPHDAEVTGVTQCMLLAAYKPTQIELTTHTDRSTFEIHVR